MPSRLVRPEPNRNQRSCEDGGVVVRTESLLEIVKLFEQAGAAAAIELDVLDPDRGAGRYAGEVVDIDGVSYVHRPFRVWVDLAERLGFRLSTPRPIEAPLVRLRFERLATEASVAVDDPAEKYGASSEFARTTKLEEPGFVIDFAEALDRVELPERPRILDLGVNTGDELALMLALRPSLREATFVGVDRSTSALAKARERFPFATFVEADLDQPLELGEPFDLVVTIATLQSPSIDDRALLRRVFQRHLTPTGAVILGVPNCRIVDGEQRYGARMKNFRQPELGLLIKDVAFYRKYLQQHARQVFVTGKNYLFVTGVPA
ncbi:MAG: class I SAM-dependent methyltransferase [Deltaproteobacteria bacterium]|nr:class I SAM-dependent methyltransferase [Deltaproteobacteria bacterium]